MMNRRFAFSSLIAALAVLALAPAAMAGPVHAKSGAVSATVTYTGPSYQTKNLRLSIVRAGKTVVSNQPVTYSCGSYCILQDVRVKDIEKTGEPDVIVDIFTGGAHCCSIALVYRYDASTGRYGRTSQYFGNSGYALDKIAGNYVFVTNNDAFYYAFASYAASGAPIQIFALSGTRFYDVTREYPALLRGDAAYWWKTYRMAIFDKQRPETEGLFADWAADEELLGHGGLVNKTLASELRKHHLRSGFVPPRKYPRELHKFLHKLGFTAG